MTSIPKQILESVPWSRWTDSAVTALIDKSLSSSSSSPASSKPSSSSSTSSKDGANNITNQIESVSPEVDPVIAQLKKNNQELSDSHLPALSIMIIISNLRKLNARSSILSDVQYQLARFFSWKEPAFTLTMLSIYTYVCIYPNLLVCFPVLGLILGVLVPGFDKRHPAQDIGIEPVDKPRKPEFDEMHIYTPDLEPPKLYTKQDRDVMMALRQLQNSLTRLVKLLEGFDHFVYTTGSFVNETDSTALFIILLFALPGLIYGASFVPVNAFIISTGWILVCSCHPTFQEKAHKFKEDYAEYLVTDEEWLEMMFEDFGKKHIIIDEPPQEHTVEIFELQRQGLTPRMWDPWVYTPAIYSANSPYRIAQSRPPGTRFIEDVKPPAGWSFYEHYPWELDVNTKGWVLDRDIKNVEIDVDHHWAYDSQGGVHGEWRRRRWVRKCFRQAAEPFKQK